MWPASAKLGNRSTANIMVKPIAATARTAPDMMPLATSWTNGLDHDARPLPTQEDGANFWIVGEVGRRPVLPVLSEHEDVGAVRDGQRVERVLLDHQHRDPGGFDG